MTSLLLGIKYLEMKSLTSSFLGIFVINNFIATELQIIISIFAVEKKKELAIKPVSRENKVNSRKDI